MSHFISQLVARHTQSEGSINPRPKARFETNSVSDWNGREGFKEIQSDDISEIKKNGEANNNNQSKEAINIDNLPFYSIKNITKNFIQPQTDVDKTREQYLINEDLNQSDFIKPPIKTKRQISSFFEEDKHIETPIAFAISNKKESSEDKRVSNSLSPITRLVEKQNSYSSNTPSSLSPFNQETQDFKSNTITPIIKVSIGRIDVRATIQKKTPVTKKRREHKPKMSLEDYLNKQK